MDDVVVLRHRGRDVTVGELEAINQLIDERPDASRRQLSALLCEKWNWRQPNGELRDMVCRSLMLELHRSRYIQLPPMRFRPPNNAVLAHTRQRPSVDIDRTPVRCSLQELGPLSIEPVRRTGDDPLFDALLDEHHYLAYTRPVGEHLKYLVTTVADRRPVACLGWSSPARRLGLRDRFIGWTPEVRRRNTHFIAYNTRFLILPWIEVPHLASHLLGRAARRIAADWTAQYAHPVYYLETFIEPSRFRGTCYRAANWIVLGRTVGRGHNSPTHEQRVPIKELLGYPLVRDFRERLTQVD